MRVLRVLALAGALAGAGTADAPTPAAALTASARPAVTGGPEPAQAVCGPYRCFARPFWRYRPGAGFMPYRGFGPAAPPPRFPPFAFRRFGGYGGFGGGFRGRFGGFGGGFGGGRRGGFRRF